MLNNQRFLPMLLLPFLFFLMAFRQALLIDPAPIAIPAKLNQTQVAKAIATALVHREWVINGNEPGKFSATYAQRGFSVHIGITYDHKDVRIKYLDSSNLKYEVKAGQPYIHVNYNSWIQNLVTDISGNLNVASF